MGRYRTRGKESARNTQAMLENKMKSQTEEARRLDIAEASLLQLDLRGGPRYLAKRWRDAEMKQIAFKKKYMKEVPNEELIREIEAAEARLAKLLKSIDRMTRENSTGQRISEVIPNVPWDIENSKWGRWGGSFTYCYELKRS